VAFERLAKRLQEATDHKYAWFGCLWPYCLLTQIASICAWTVPLSQDVIRSHVVVWLLFWTLFFVSNMIGVLSVVLDKRTLLIEIPEPHLGNAEVNMLTSPDCKSATSVVLPPDEF